MAWLPFQKKLKTVQGSARPKEFTKYPSHDSSVGSISAEYWGGLGFNSWQGQELLI